MPTKKDAAEGLLIAGRYRLAEQLGAGGMGAVWAGHDTLVGREVALKEAHLAADGRVSAARVERTLREARAAARIGHPAVVTIHDVVTHDGRPWIVMERIHGENLGERLERQTALPEQEAARIAAPVAQALGAAHAHGVLHRDVKPTNVLLGRDGRVVLTDFGIARIEGDEPLTHSGEFIGSFEYAAPERMGARRPGPASDLWSLGAMLYRMVEGQSPFRRATVEGTVAAVLTGKIPRPKQAVGLAPLIAALLDRDPANRPTADETAQTLLTAARSLPAQRGPDDGVPQPRTAPVSGGGESPRVRRRLAVVTLTAVAVASGAALTPTAAGMLRGGGNPHSSAKPTAKTTAGRTPGPSPHTTAPPLPPAAAGYVRMAEKAFTVEVPDGWQLQDAEPASADKFVFTQGPYQVVVVAGRDATGPYGGDPADYELTEPELADFRNSERSEAWGLERVRIGGRAAARGTFAWRDAKGVHRYAENTVLVGGGRFHIVLVTGPDTKAGRELVSRVAEHASQTYSPAPVT